MKIIQSVEINKTPEEVFAFINNLSNHTYIFKANIESKQISEGPIGVGTKMKNVAKFLGKNIEEHFVITSYAPNDHIKKESVAGSTFPTWDVMSVKPTAQGTLFTFDVWAKPVSYLKLFGPLLKPIVSRAIKKDLYNMKKILET